MTREIKFRFWDKENKKFPLVLCLADAFGEYECNLERYEIMQYTGLKDKNGKEIYEGDIVNYGGHIGYIEYEYGCFLISGLIVEYEGTYWRTDIIEIIGNIYENPDLINKK